MLQYIVKDEYFGWIDRYAELRADYASAAVTNLKDVQDHFAISILDELPPGRVLEVGGADCRVLRNFAGKHECWNAEKFEGLGIGPKKVIATEGVRNVSTYIGEFSPELPDGAFDMIFSVSVVEHVETPQLDNFFRDIARLLKPGGLSCHAIDLYLLDEKNLTLQYADYARARMDAYLSVPATTNGQMEFVEEPVATREPVFACNYASNSDREMKAWNRYAPTLAPLRSVSQSCSLKMVMRRRA